MQFRHDALNKKTPGGKHRVIPEKPLSVEEIVDNVRKRGKKASDFQSLFFCYRTPSASDLLALELLADAVSEEYLDVEVEFVTTPPDVSRTFADTGHGRIVESSEH